MKSGKKVLGVIIVSLLLISSISLVSAGLKDWFVFGEGEGNLEGELPDSFNIGITMSNQAPNITNWTVGSPTPTPCSTSSTGTFTVYIKDPDGYADLADAVVTLQISNTHATLGFITKSSASCSLGANDGAYVQAFTCSAVTMNYWDDGGIGDPWLVTVTATDGTDNAINNDGAAGQQRSKSNSHIYYPNLIYSTSKSPQLKDDNDADYTTGGAGTDTITWDTIQTSSFDEIADRYLMTRNCGNVIIPSTEITGETLESASESTYIEPDSFAVCAADATGASPGTCTECAAGELSYGVDQLNQGSVAEVITSSGLIVYTTDEVRKNFRFCLENINPDGVPDPIIVSTYASNIGGAVAWDITFN